MNYIAVSAAVLTIASCVRKELPVPAHEPGANVTATVSMGADYRWQYFYDLETNTVVGKNLKDSWNLGFETSRDGYRVILNTALPMFAYPTGKTAFASVVMADTAGRKKWDSPTGAPDSTAIGDWRASGQVYIIDRGYSADLVHQGYRKVQFLTVDESRYSVRIARMNGSDEVVIDVPKDSLYNFTFLSLDASPAVVQAEPPRDKWDLVFTQYTHIFYDLNEPYLVTGCLLNRFSTAAVMDSTVGYADITYTSAQGYSLSPFINTIGYDWKTVGSTGGGGSDYKVHIHMNYIIRTSSQSYFKLRFIDFYDNKVKGNPKWEFQKL